MNDDINPGAGASSSRSNSNNNHSNDLDRNRRRAASDLRRHYNGRHRRRSTRASAQQPPGPGGGGGDQAGGRPSRSSSVPPERSSVVMRKVRAGLTKKLHFFTDLMRQLDMLVYAELCAIYYMECSFFRFFLRAVAQTFFLSPKPDDFLLVSPAHKPHVVAVFAPNLLCLLVHLLAPLPRAAEVARGYLHGGIFVDFVGQTPPTSRYVLVLLDLLVLAVQCLMLAVHTEREKLRKMIMPMRGSSSSAAAAATAAIGSAAAAGVQQHAATAATAATAALSAPAAPAAQDHDAEERAVLRQPGESSAAAAAESIEMQPLPRRDAGAGGDDPPGPAAERNEDGDGDRFTNIDIGGPPQLGPEAAADYVLDALSSGNNLSDFYIVHAIRSASRDYQGAAAQSLQSIGYAVTLARLAAERGARAEAGPRPQ